MKANTIVHIALRNIGESNDSGEFFEGQLKEGIMWIAAALGSKSMAKRFAIGIGRDKAGAMAAIDLKRSGQGLSIELEDELNRIMGLADGDEPEEPGFAEDARDSWKGIEQ